MGKIGTFQRSDEMGAPVHGFQLSDFNIHTNYYAGWVHKTMKTLQEI